MQDDGERELVLGNKQLLTIFFVAALLCGVFFAVGYVVGGNSAKSNAAVAAADSSPAPASDGKREEPQAQSPNAGDATTTATSEASSTDAGSLPGSEPRMADNPAAAGSQPAAPVPAAPAPVQAAQSALSAKASAPGPTTAATAYISDPERGGAYWQVTAAKRPNADVLVKALREAGLPAILSNSSKPELFEVLVGPYHSATTLAETKRKLIDLGYNGIVIHKQ